jgi:hypothetical protein
MDGLLLGETMYDKDWEVHLALNNPLDPIHGYIEDYLEQEDRRSETPSEISESPEKQTQSS